MEPMILDSSRWVYRPSLRRWEVDLGLRGQDAHGQLLAGHLQAEDAADLAGPGGVDRHVDGQGALAHGGTGAQDDQVGPLQPAQVLVQVRESRHDGHPRGSRVGRSRGLLLQVLVIDLPEGDEAAGLASASHGEEGVLSFPHGGLKVIGVVVSEGRESWPRRR